jgi:hypothetical protein
LENSGCSVLWLFAFCIVRSRLPTKWQARVASNQSHRSQTDKPEPTSDDLMHNDAQECAGRLEHTHDSSPRHRLKSPANLGIPESEWHESIHSILCKAVPRHTPCHKGLGSRIQVLATHLHHPSKCQDTWQGQRHASKQRTSLYSMAQVSSSSDSCLWCHVDSHTWRQSHATELIFHRKMRSIHKAGQQNL